jgi:hypothetical protein
MSNFNLDGLRYATLFNLVLSEHGKQFSSLMMAKTESYCGLFSSMSSNSDFPLRHRVQRLLIRRLVHECTEKAAVPSEQVLWRVELGEFARVQDQLRAKDQSMNKAMCGTTYDLVRVRDRLKPVCDGDDRDVAREPRAECSLDRCVHVVVDRGRGFVDDEQLAPPYERSGKRDDLALSHGEVRAARRDGAVKRQATFVSPREEPRGTDCVVQLGVVVLAEHVQVLSDRAAQELRRLRNDCDRTAECVKVEAGCGGAVVEYLTLGEDAPEEREGESALATARSADDGDTLTGFDLQRDLVEYDWTVGGVPGGQVLDLQVSRSGPVRRQDASLGGSRFLLDLEIRLNTLQAVGLDLELVEDPDDPEEDVTEADLDDFEFLPMHGTETARTAMESRNPTDPAVHCSCPGP